MELVPSKIDVMNVLLTRSSVFIHLDPSKPGVLIPARLRLQGQVVLQFGTDMPVPIPDLRVEDKGVYGTLSFSGVPFTCWIPWDSVFALVGEDARGVVWPEDMPTSVKSEIEHENKAKELTGSNVVLFDSSRPRKNTNKVSSPKGATRDHLRIVR